MFGSFGMLELTLILVIVLIVFGAGRLPQLGEGLGKAIKGFKRSVHEPDTIQVTADQVSQPEHAAPHAAPAGPEAVPGEDGPTGPSDHKGKGLN